MVVVMDHRVRRVVGAVMGHPMVRRPMMRRVMDDVMMDGVMMDHVVAVVMDGGRRADGRERQGGGRGDGQGDEFHGLISQFRPRITRCGTAFRLAAAMVATSLRDAGMRGAVTWA